MKKNDLDFPKLELQEIIIDYLMDDDKAEAINIINDSSCCIYSINYFVKNYSQTLKSLGVVKKCELIYSFNGMNVSEISEITKTKDRLIDNLCSANPNSLDRLKTDSRGRFEKMYKHLSEEDKNRLLRVKVYLAL